MKKALSRILMITILAVFMLSSLNALAAVSIPLPNGGFESKVVDWGTMQGGGGWTNVHDMTDPDTTIKYEGNQSWRYLGNDNVYQYLPSPVEGHKYRFSVMVRLEDVVANESGMGVYLTNNHDAEEKNKSDALVGTMDWTELTVEFTAHVVYTDTDWLNDQLCINFNNATGKVWIDDAKLTDLDATESSGGGGGGSGGGSAKTADPSLIFVCASMLPVGGAALLVLRNKKK